jgi:hypothetical protein
MDRDLFLERVGASLRRAAEARPPKPSPSAVPVLPVPEDREGMVQLFADRLHELQGVAIRVPSREAALADIAALLQDPDGLSRHSDGPPCHCAASPRHPHDPPSHADGPPRHSDDPPRDSDGPPRHSDDSPRHRDTRIACPPSLVWPAIEERWTADPREADFGLSEAEWGIAASATVVLRHRGEYGRAFSLVPPAVGFLLPVSRLMPRLTPVVAAVHDDADAPPACITFVSGASHSSDIAGISCFGVHGPADVRVWLIEDE